MCSLWGRELGGDCRTVRTNRLLDRSAGQIDVLQVVDLVRVLVLNASEQRQLLRHVLRIVERVPHSGLRRPTAGAGLGASGAVVHVACEVLVP